MEKGLEQAIHKASQDKEAIRYGAAFLAAYFRARRKGQGEAFLKAYLAKEAEDGKANREA